MSMGNGWKPTQEQEAALAAYGTGESLIVEAGAGTGKTATLVLLAKSDASRRGQYIAFNRAIVEESRARMPGHVTASTAHSLAFRALGHRYADRLNQGQRMRSWELARLMGVQGFRVGEGDGSKVVEDHVLASRIMEALTIFCQSADPRPDARRHLAYIDGIDQPDEQGRRTFKWNNAVAEHVQPYLERVWRDINQPRGQFQFKHEHYLKMWQLSGPVITTDVIFFDESQDISPVIEAIILAQDHAQLVLVGDPNQSIYGWTGAVDAMSRFDAQNRTTLSQSFRFGEAVADAANRVLAWLPTDLTLTGQASIPSALVPIAQPDALLCRTNAAAVGALMAAQARGESAHMVGGGKDVIAFARGKIELSSRGRSSHRDLACFKAWGEVQEYVERDRQGEELRLLVNLVDDFGAEAIITALEMMPAERDADLVISTAHKAKGREWGSVKLADDFPAKEPGSMNDDGDPDGPSDDELRLLYVAVTRARLELDAGSAPWVCEDGAVSDDEPDMGAAA